MSTSVSGPGSSPSPLSVGAVVGALAAGASMIRHGAPYERTLGDRILAPTLSAALGTGGGAIGAVGLGKLSNTIGDGSAEAATGLGGLGLWCALRGSGAWRTSAGSTVQSIALLG